MHACKVLLATAVWAAAVVTPAVHAERADRDKPMQIEADALRYDEQNQTSVFSGRVVMSKGSILIRGGRVQVRQDAQGNQYGVIQGEAGALAFFRQKREGLDEYFEGESETIEYDGRADTVTLSQRARLRRLRGTSLADELSGSVIVYNNLTEIFRIDGTPGRGPAGRVRAMLTPQVSAQPAAPASAVPAPLLRETRTLGGTAP